jgi:hypothetical protein
MKHLLYGDRIIMKKSAKANVIPKRQRTQYTCMTTSVSMCLQALGHPHADEDTVNKTLGAMPMRGACWEQALACCNHYGFRSTLIVPATLPQLKQYTDQGFPIIIAYNPEGKDWSHASVIFDIDDELNVHIADPNMADPDETVRVMSKSDFYKVWSEPYNGYTIRRPAMVIQPEISSDGRQLLASYFNKGDKQMSKKASDLGKLSEELSMLSEQMIMSKKKPKKSQPTTKKEEKKLTFTPKPPRNEAARALAENRSRGDGSGAHKNKQDFARGKRRNPKHKNRREYSLQQPLSTRPDYGVRNAELEEQAMKMSELDMLAMELEARIKSKENHSDKEVQESIDQHFPNGSPDINKVRENAKGKNSESMVSEQEIDAVEKALLSMMENGEMEKMALLSSDIDSMLSDIEDTLKTSGDKTAMTRKQKENAIAKRISPSDKRGRGANRVIMLTGDIAKVLKKDQYHSQKMVDFSDEEIDTLYNFMYRKRASVEQRTRMTDRVASASGLYGFTKGVQRDCESAIRKVAKSATRIAKQLWAKDQGTCAFLNTHSKRAKSLSAKVLLTAMKEIGPKVASISEYTPNMRLAGKSGYGLYGFKSKTAQLGLSACSELKGSVGEITADLHNRRTAKREKIVGFLKEHNKVGKCVFSKFMLSAYPDGEMGKSASVNEFVPDTVQGWIEWED